MSDGAPGDRSVELEPSFQTGPSGTLCPRTALPPASFDGRLFKRGARHLAFLPHSRSVLHGFSETGASGSNPLSTLGCERHLVCRLSASRLFERCVTSRLSFPGWHHTLRPMCCQLTADFYSKPGFRRRRTHFRVYSSVDVFPIASWYNNRNLIFL